jgi:hypothetical protein
MKGLQFKITSLHNFFNKSLFYCTLPSKYRENSFLPVRKTAVTEAASHAMICRISAEVVVSEGSLCVLNMHQTPICYHGEEICE